MNKKRFCWLYILTVTLLFIDIESFAQTLPTSSPFASVTQRIGLTDVTITYFRPSVKGREIWGNLVPFGYAGSVIHPDDLRPNPESIAPWRAGANNATTIELTHDVEIEGVSIPKGKYALFIAPFENNEAEIIISSTWDQVGSLFYNPAQDVARIRIKCEESDFKEELEFEFNNVTLTSAEAALIWERKKIPFNIRVNTTEIVGKELVSQLQSPQSITPTWRLSAAVYLMNNQIYLDRAEKIAQWLTTTPGLGFPAYTTYGNILLLNGKKQEGDSIINAAFDLKPSAGNLRFYGTQALSLGFPDVAIKTYNYLKDEYPKNEWAAYNGLANAYSMKGDYERAVELLNTARPHAPENYDIALWNAKIQKLKNQEDIN